jgi:hypothetical protein
MTTSGHLRWLDPVTNGGHVTTTTAAQSLLDEEFPDLGGHLVV